MNLEHPKDGSVELRKLVLYWKFLTNYHQGEPRIEIRIDSISGDGSQTWVIISNGPKNLVRDLTEQTRTLDEIESIWASTGQLVAQEPRIVEHSQIEAGKFAAKAKPKRKRTSNPLPPFSSEQIPLSKQELILNVGPQEHKRITALLRHRFLPWDKNTAIDFF